MLTRPALAGSLFVLLWSTGFIGARYGLPHAEPFTFLALRLALACALLVLLARLTRAPAPTGRGQYAHAAVVGLLLHAGYLGGVFFAISRGVPAAVAAVVTSLQPVVTAGLATRLLGEQLRARQWVGLLAGLAGVALVLSPGLAGAPLPTGALLGTVVALASGTGATLYQKRHGARVPLLTGTAVQYAAASGVLLLAALLTEDLSIDWTPTFALALAWLVLVLSLGAVLLLLLLLRRGSAASVSSLLYLVPPATALEAWVAFGDRLAPIALCGIAVTAAGVALVTLPSRRR